VNSAAESRFEAGLVSEVDEPIRRYFTHALAPGAKLGHGGPADHGRPDQGRRLDALRSRMAGRWALFRVARPCRPTVPPTARMTTTRRATAARTFASSAGLGWCTARGDDATRSAAGRAAVEAAIWAPGSLLPSRGVAWHADSEDEIVGTWEVPPERPEGHIRIDGAGGRPYGQRDALRRRLPRPPRLHPLRRRGCRRSDTSGTSS
jgi:hypothetical protein